MTFGEKIGAETAREHRTNDPYLLCDLLGIDVVESFFKCNRMKGIIVHDDWGTGICLSIQMTMTQKRFVLAHELGHYFLHPQRVGRFWIQENTLFPLGKIEKEADDFAYAFLGACVVRPKCPLTYAMVRA